MYVGNNRSKIEDKLIENIWIEVEREKNNIIRYIWGILLKNLICVFKVLGGEERDWGGSNIWGRRKNC